MTDFSKRAVDEAIAIADQKFRETMQFHSTAPWNKPRPKPIEPDIMSEHIDNCSQAYNRESCLGSLLPAWLAKDPLRRDQIKTLEDLSKEQLRTALCLFFLRRRAAGHAKHGYVVTRAWIRAEERIRCRQLSWEADLKLEGALT